MGCPSRKAAAVISVLRVSPDWHGRSDWLYPIHTWMPRIKCLLARVLIVLLLLSTIDPQIPSKIERETQPVVLALVCIKKHAGKQRPSIDKHSYVSQ